MKKYRQVNKTIAKYRKVCLKAVEASVGTRVPARPETQTGRSPLICSVIHYTKYDMPTCKSV
eukprot:12657173-Heterocapsa_arctica.AAC.1